MVELFGTVVEDLRNLNAEIVAVNTGDGNELLHDRVFAIGIIPTTEEAKPDLRNRLEGISTVRWQGHEWNIEGGIVPSTTVTRETWYTVYQRGFGVGWEPLFDVYHEMLLDELRAMNVDELRDHSWWRVRGRQIKADGYLGERDSQVYALAELDLSTEEIADVLEISPGNVANRLASIRSTYGDIDGALGR